MKESSSGGQGHRGESGIGAAALAVKRENIVKYCAYVRQDMNTLFVIDEYSDEVFADIFPHDHVPGRLGSAERKLTEFGFTRVGDWEQFPDSGSWVAEVTKTDD